MQVVVIGNIIIQSTSKQIMKKAFTLIELIFVIVIIGVLASVAIPKFAGLSDNSKIAAELSTAASVQVAIDACHGEWIINEGTFVCGRDINSTDLNGAGYPANDTLGTSDQTPLNRILKSSSSTGWTRNNNNYTGPAEQTWIYNDQTGTFTLSN